MKRLMLAVALAAFAASATGTAFARDDDRRGRDYHKVERDYWKERRKAERRAWKDYEKAEKEYWKDRRKAEKAYHKALREDERAYRRWARGQYIPAEYRQPRYYVDDYRAYRLAPPPRGYTYVRPYQDDDTYYLIELATGLVAQILGD